MSADNDTPQSERITYKEAYEILYKHMSHIPSLLSGVQIGRPECDFEGFIEYTQNLLKNTQSKLNDEDQK